MGPAGLLFRGDYFTPLLAKEGLGEVWNLLGSTEPQLGNFLSEVEFTEFKNEISPFGQNDES